MDVPADGFVRMETRDLGVGNIGTMGGMSWGGKKMSLERGRLSAALGHFVVQWHLQRGTEAGRSFVLVCRLGGKLSRSRVPRRGGAEEEAPPGPGTPTRGIGQGITNGKAEEGVLGFKCCRK